MTLAEHRNRLIDRRIAAAITGTQPQPRPRPLRPRARPDADQRWADAIAKEVRRCAN